MNNIYKLAIILVFIAFSSILSQNRANAAVKIKITLKEATSIELDRSKSNVKIQNRFSKKEREIIVNIKKVVKYEPQNSKNLHLSDDFEYFTIENRIQKLNTKIPLELQYSAINIDDKYLFTIAY